MNKNVVNLSDFKKKMALKEKIESETEEKSLAVLTDEQIDRIMYATINDREEDEDPSEEEMIAVLEWAQTTMVRVTFLNLMLKGKVSIKWDEDKNFLFSATEESEEE